MKDFIVSFIGNDDEGDVLVRREKIDESLKKAIITYSRKADRSPVLTLFKTHVGLK